ncbi:MAG: sigma-70 family RNA polymerase sigma factor [Planctomycetia bacterium]|nr:sigma-70 family RNA polymerase sigma factor [Planctomycetia bacterium]
MFVSIAPMVTAGPSFLPSNALGGIAHILLMARMAENDPIVGRIRLQAGAMSPRSRNRQPPLAVVSNDASMSDSISRGRSDEARARSLARDVDWSILMARAQGGDGEAYRRLLGEIVPYVRSLVAPRHRDPRDVEDTTQDVLLTIHSIRHTYDPTRPFTPWLVAIAHRRAIDRLRQQGRSRLRDDALKAEYETFGEPLTNIEETRSEEHSLHKAVERLPPGQREAVKLLKLQEMSLREASKVSGMSVAALKVAMHRALKSLRKILGSKSEKT